MSESTGNDEQVLLYLTTVFDQVINEELSHNYLHLLKKGLGSVRFSISNMLAKTINVTTTTCPAIILSTMEKKLRCYNCA